MEKPFYITTSIVYTNASPHIGYAFELVLADVIARYQRSKGETFFLTGTDEHGTKILRSAQKAGLTPQAFVDDRAAEVIELGKLLSISNDMLIRTSDKEHHWSGAQQLWRDLEEAGDIYKHIYKGLYCVGCEGFVQEKDLVDGKCPIHDTAPEEVEEENYFFRLAKYGAQIKNLILTDEIKIVPESRKQEALALLEQGLEDVSFSRPEESIPWGVPVPNDPSHMMYVWCDALANYISALGYGSEDQSRFERLWPADVQVIGKDILRFHAAIWPAMLLSAGVMLPKTIAVHGFITSEGKKMSKSLGNVIDPFKFMERYSPESLRYYFAREMSPFEDSDFTEERFVEAYNANLANGLGNLVSRTFKMAQQYFDGTVTRRLAADVPMTQHLETAFGDAALENYTIPYVATQKIVPAYDQHMQALDVQKAADEAWRLIGVLDRYITEHEPFKLIKGDPGRTENIIWSVLFGIHTLIELIAPILPETAATIHGKLQAEVSAEGDPERFTVTPLDAPLFARIETQKHD